MWFMIDIEADGPCPGLYSMIQIGAVLVDEEGEFDKTFYGELKPVSEKFKTDALESFGCTREKSLFYKDPVYTMLEFNEWIEKVNEKGRPMFISDNNGFDWQFINYYFWKFVNDNPFGYSSTNLGSLYKGVIKDTYKNFKYLRKTKHDHNPVNDAKGNAEALLEIIKRYDLKMPL